MEPDHDKAVYLTNLVFEDRGLAGTTFLQVVTVFVFFWVGDWVVVVVEVGVTGGVQGIQDRFAGGARESPTVERTFNTVRVLNL